MPGPDRSSSTDGPNQADPLKQALAEYLAIPGMKAAILVSDQGLVVSGVAHADVDATGIAALVIDTVASAQRFGLQVQAGFLDTMSIEFERLTVVLAPFTPDVMLALVATPGSLRGLHGDLGTGRRGGAGATHSAGTAGSAPATGFAGRAGDEGPRNLGSSAQLGATEHPHTHTQGAAGPAQDERRQPACWE